MRHVSILLLSVSMLLIGMSVIWQSARPDTPVRTFALADEPDVGIAHAFYAGIDAILAGSDPSALESVLAADFVDHAGAAPDRDASALVAHLQSFGQRFPGVQMAVHDVHAASGNLLVAMAPITLPQVGVAGLSMSVAPAPGAMDILRVRDGKISERWGDGLPAIDSTTFDAGFRIGSGGSVAVRLDRVHLPPGASVRWTAESVVVLVERGVAKLRHGFVPGAMDEIGEPLLLAAGSVTAVVPRPFVELEGAGDEAAEVLILWTRRVTAVEPPPQRFEGDATSTLVWAENLSGPAFQPWSVDFGRIAASGHLDLSLTAPAGTSAILSLHAGSVRLTAAGGSIAELDALANSHPRELPAMLPAGSTVRAAAPLDLTLHVPEGESASLWIIVIGPAQPTEI